MHQNLFNLNTHLNTNSENGYNFNALEFSTMPMNDMHLDEWFHQEHIEQLDEDMNKWRTD